VTQLICVGAGVKFPMMEKIDVNKDNTHPVYQLLKVHSAPSQKVEELLLISGRGR
jgi:glutathione peroxidase-family protein